VMRVARTSRATCGKFCQPMRRRPAAAVGRLCMFAVLLAASVLVPARPADAQDPSLNASSGSSKSTAFPKQQGGMFGNTRAVDKALPLYLQGDQLIYDTKRNQVVAKGNVEIYYNDNILTADEVIYDQGASTLTAVGNVELK